MPLLTFSPLFAYSGTARTHTDPVKMILKEGDDLRLICDVIDGMPLNVTQVKWIKTGGQESKSNGDVIINETTQNEIVWAGIDRNSGGNYSCMAANAAGWGNIS